MTDKTEKPLNWIHIVVEKEYPDLDKFLYEIKDLSFINEIIGFDPEKCNVRHRSEGTLNVEVFYISSSLRGYCAIDYCEKLFEYIKENEIKHDLWML